ncbi:MAG TPA: hypothetical protein VKD72_16155, partial [Gemmataceae bacterium]|nr:hypothetical protein [Gemmataceae bacterium]
LGSTRFRHAGLRDYVCLSGSKTVLTAGNDRVLRLWDLASGRLLSARPLQGKTGPGHDVTLSPDGRLLAAIDKGRIIIWEVASGKELKALPAPKSDHDPKTNADRMYNLLRFSPDGKTLAVGRSDWHLSFWDWETGKGREAPSPVHLLKIVKVFDPDYTGYHGNFSPDGKLFVAGDQANHEPVGVVEVATGREIARFPHPANRPIVSPDSKRLAVSSYKKDPTGGEQVVRLFDLASRKEVAQFPLGREVWYQSFAFAPDGKTLACGFSDRGCLLDCATGRVLYRLTGWAMGLSFSPDGKLLLSRTDCKLRLWDTATGKELQERPSNYFGWGGTTAFSPDGRLLATACGLDHTVSLWDTKHGRMLRQMPLKDYGTNVRHLAFSPDGKTLVAGQVFDFPRFWEVATGKEQRTVQLTDPARRNLDPICFNHLRISPDGKRMCTLERRLFGGKAFTELVLWDLTTGRPVSQHSLPGETPATCAWSADGLTVTLPLKDGLTLMQVETGLVRVRIPGTCVGGPLAVSPDDRLLAAPMPKGVVGVWETATGKEVTAVAAGPVSYLALTPDNRHLVTAHENLLRVWDLATGKERRRWSLPGPAGQLLLFPDGRRAFTALADRTALVWDLTPALRRGPRAESPDESKLTAWWADLAAADSRRASAAIWRLSEAPEATVPFLLRRLQPPADAEIKEVRRHIVDLDSPRFATREKAFERLLRLGETAEPVLRHALEKNPSLEVRRRIQLLLTRLAQRPLSGETLRTLRALDVLEHTGAEGQRLLRELAGGVEEACLTREARVSLNRLARRSP